ncbi:MAG: hypothetical protein JHC34_06360 [Acidobacteria bacterium]|jgi:hypothetical protein|nr:hypothetical protein [Acidobacteriota bacterium]
MAVFLWLLGALFLLAAAAPEAVAGGKVVPRLIVGLLLFLGGLVLIIFAWRSGKNSPTADSAGGGKSAQEPPGQLSLKALTCPHCGGQADAASVKVGPEGTMSVTCQYCGAVYLIQEEPKW